MTNQSMPEPNHYESFLKEWEAFEKFAQIVQASQAHGGPAALKDEAQKNLDKYIWENLPGGDEQRTLFGSIENVPGEARQEVVKHDAEAMQQKAATTFYEHLDSLVEDIKPKTLEALVASPIIRSRAQGEEAQTISTYYALKQFESFVKRYNETSRIETQSEEQTLRGAAVQGYAKTQADKVKGESEKKFIQTIATIAMQSGLSRRQEDSKVADLIKKYAKPGLEEQKKRIKAEYDKRDTDIYGVMKKILKGTKELATNAPEEFAKIYQSVYAAEKGKLKFEPIRYGGQEE